MTVAGQQMSRSSWWFRLGITDATSGTPLATGIVSFLAALTIGSLAGTNIMLPGWADPFNLGLTAVLFQAPLAIGSGATAAGWLLRHDVLTFADTTPRGRRAALTITTASVLLWQAAAVAGLLAVVLLRSDLAGPLTPAMLLLPALDVALVVAMVLVGSAVGSHVKTVFGAPVLAVGVFVWLYASAYAPGRWKLLSPTYSEIFYQNYFEPNHALVGGQALIATAVAISAAAVLFRRTAYRWVAVGVAFGLTVAGGASLSVASIDPVQYRSPPAQAACATRDRITLCVWPDSSDVLQPSLDALVSVARSARPYIAISGSFFQPGLQSLMPRGTVYNVPATRQEGGFDFVALRAAVDSVVCGKGRSRAASEFAGWLSARSSASYYSASSGRVSHLPRAKQQYRVNQWKSQFGRC